MKNSTLRGFFFLSMISFTIIGTSLLFLSYKQIGSWGGYITVPYEYLRIPAITCYIGAIVSLLFFIAAVKRDSRRKEQNI